MLSFSIVINTFNRASSLRRTLEGLTLLDYPLFEVVVVNGPSTDDTETVLAEFGARIKVARLDERNLSMSRNLGIAAAAGDIVAFIDDDAYPDPAWLDRLAEAYDRDEVAGAGGPTYDHTGYALQARFSLATRMGRSWQTAASDFRPDYRLSRPYANVFPYTIGTNSSFRRTRLVEIGGFDEEFEYYYDETDLCVRLIDRGLVIQTLTDGYVYHKFLSSERRSENYVLRDRFSALKNHVYFALKHGLATASFFDVCSDFAGFVEDQRKDYEWCVYKGWLTNDDFRQFESDIHRAFDMGFDRFLSGVERTRTVQWFAERQEPFVSFGTCRPAGEKLHLCFVSPEYPPGPVDDDIRFIHEKAMGLGEIGHYVHVLTPGENHHRIDLEDAVWVHRIVPEPAASPATEEEGWNSSATLQKELLRVHRHRPLDLVEAPSRDSERIAVLLGGSVPVVTAPPEREVHGEGISRSMAAEAAERFYADIIARKPH